MKKANVQVMIFPTQENEKPYEKVLALGKEFARQYHLPAPQKLIHVPYQKPWFEQGSVNFSVSHSGDYWVCALGDVPLGVDIQKHKPCNTELIARRFYHPDEAVWVREKPITDFFKIWTAKESYVKLTGEGITDDFSSFTVINAHGRIETCNNMFLQHVTFEEGYSLCLCTNLPAHITVIFKTG